MSFIEQNHVLLVRLLESLVNIRNAEYTQRLEYLRTVLSSIKAHDVEKVLNQKRLQLQY